MNIKSFPIKDWLQQNTIINVSGTMTALGASMVPEEIRQCVDESLGCFVNMDALQAKASSTIAQSTGAEAGCITSSVASGICISLAATMTGIDLGLVEDIPDIGKISKNEVAILKGHVVNYGSNINQKIRLVGATPIEVGTVTVAEPYQLRHAITEKTCAALWVVSHHTVQSGLLSLQTFIKLCHEKNVPVIVDAASEYDLKIFIDMGADVVLYSGHKFLSGPTSGIVAGKTDLIKAAYMHQSSGIGRAMKAGKESVVGAIAALERWGQLDHKILHEKEYSNLIKIWNGLSKITGLCLKKIPDPTGNPITRIKVSIDAHASSLEIGELCQALLHGNPTIVVRDHHINLGFFEIDPCNMKPGDPEAIILRFQELESLLEKNNSMSSIKDILGPRLSSYDIKDIPMVDTGKVPWTYDCTGDREESLKCWPERYLQH
jgi:L-seryl-tRNA(Ser) seleniumtransferase